MTHYRIPYGKTQIEFELPYADLIAPAALAIVSDEHRAISDAIDAPLNFSWAKFANAQSVAIAINDKTRPVPLALLLPPLLQKLESLGIKRDAVTLIIATGTHVPMRSDEFKLVVPANILEQYRVISHDCDDTVNMIDLGTTTRGTHVLANRTFVTADLRIAIGDIEPHQFMGFSGGVKAAAIGVSARETITHNHSLMMDKSSYQGRYEDNPTRQDVEEIGKMMRVDFALNPVINEEKKIVGVFAGEPRAVMQAGMPLSLDLYRVWVAQPFDLMIVSAGGHPKDINVYQAQKAVGHAIPVMKPGGTLIWAAACPEGSGSQVYEKFAGTMSSYAQVLDYFQSNPFKLGVHKAFQIARDATQVRLLMITELAPELSKRLMLNRIETMDEAIRTALQDLPAGAHIGVMPVGNVTIPMLSGTDEA